MNGIYKVGDIVVAIVEDISVSLHKGCVYKVIHQYNDGWVELVPINKLDTVNGFDAQEIQIKHYGESQEVAMKRLKFTDTKWISETYS